jgi:predicted Zn-dependent protease with MMP-like domain
MTTIREILDIEKNGRNTIKEQKELDEILECVDDLTGVFVGSKRINSVINEMSGSFVEPMKKAMNALKVYENKALNEETMTKAAARILAYDISKYLKESYDALTANKRAFREMDKSGVSLAFSTALFELYQLCEEHDILVEDFVNDECLREMVSDDMAKIMNEVL